MSGFNSTGSFGFTGGGGGGGGATNEIVCNLTPGLNVIDTTDKIGNNGVEYVYTLTDGVNQRSGTLLCTWNQNTNQLRWTETTTTDIGNTSLINLYFNIVGDKVRLMGAFPNNKWRFSFFKVVLESCYPYVPIPSGSYILAENGDYLITENDDYLITE